ncbi:MAG: ChbG/HpnK family deacetylase [Rhodomicrobium sp.]
MRNLIINADDYAMDDGVDAAIIELAGKGPVTAASAMVLSPRWSDAARATRDAPQISWGLHLDLTSHYAHESGFGQSLPSLVFRANAGLLNRESICVTVDKQLSLFEERMGSAPCFVDGHQHVHHLPIVRDVILNALSERYGAGKAAVGFRICLSQRWRGLKAAIIGGTGARTLRAMAEAGRHGINTDFAGVYDFAANAELPALWGRWLSRLSGRMPLIMCHVAKASSEYPSWDAIREARLREFDWLSSDEFRSFLARNYAEPARWPRV